MQHIFINFLPGSAGNFLSRFLHCAIPNSYCWTRKNQPVPIEFVDKLNLLEYSTISNTKINWINFESQLHHFSQSIDLSNFNSNSTLIWLGHNWTLEKIKNKNIVGLNDECTLVQISYNTKKDLEWILLNALYKDSYIDKQWFEYYQHNKKLETDFVSIDNFFNWNIFKNSITELLDQNKINYDLQNIGQLEDLYNSWYNTTLKFSEFEDFKKSIGWLL